MARIHHVRGPQVIKSEDTFLVAYVLFDMKPGNAEVDVVEAWVERIRTQIDHLLDFSGDNPARIVNNLDWTRDLSTISFLRDIGKHFSVARMLEKEAVAARVSDEGISFTEFSYQILQAMDYLELYRRHGCWGAISKTNGVFLRSRDPVYRDLRELAASRRADIQRHGLLALVQTSPVQALAVLRDGPSIDVQTAADRIDADNFCAHLRQGERGEGNGLPELTRGRGVQPVIQIARAKRD